MRNLDHQNPPSNLQAALEYCDQGFSVIPVGVDKKPLIAWKEYQSKRADRETITSWFKTWPTANIGIVTGAISGIVVVDIEKGGKVDDLPTTAHSRTGGGGFHYIYLYDPSRPVGNFGRIRELTDIRGDGGYIVVPPSTHKSGNKYEWLVCPNRDNLGEFPYWLIERKTEEQQILEAPIVDTESIMTDPVKQGSRNVTATKVVGKLLHDMGESLWDSVAWDALKSWNDKCCAPPLDEIELRTTFESIKKAQSKQRDEKQSQKKGEASKIIIDLFLATKPYLFHDQMGDAHVQVNSNEKSEIMKCSSSRFGKYLSLLYWNAKNKVAGKEHLEKAVRVISAQAEHNSPEIPLHNRVGVHEGDFWYDLGDSRAIRITDGSWEIKTELPVVFRSMNNQSSQAIPTQKGDIKNFLSHVHIKTPEQQLLTLVWLVAAFIPEIAHPILVLFGEKGAAKSTALSFAKLLIDPSKIGLMALPKKDELIQQLANNYAPFYDNVTVIDQFTSDTLCRGVTGAGASKRRLYTDGEDVIYQFRRVIALNGINNAVNAPDLLDRSLLIELDRISKEERKTEREVFARFEEDKPIILGGIFDTLAQARIYYNDLIIDEFPRMADFAKWGYAIAEAMGFGGKAFIDAYNGNINKQNEEVLENDIVAFSIRKFMEGRDQWEGTPTEFREELLKVLIDARLSEKEFPKNPAALGKHIKLVNSNLIDAGIKVENVRATTGAKGRLYIVTNSASTPSTAATLPDNSQPDGGSSDGSGGKKGENTAEQFLNGEGTLGDLKNDEELESVMKHHFGEQTQIITTPNLSHDIDSL